MSLDGIVFGAFDDSNEAYYGRPVKAEQILTTMTPSNPQTDFEPWLGA